MRSKGFLVDKSTDDPLGQTEEVPNEMSSFRLGHAATTGKLEGMQPEWKGITFDHRAR